MLLEKSRDQFVDFAEPPTPAAVELAPSQEPRLILELERPIDAVELVVSTAVEDRPGSTPTKKRDKILGLGQRQLLGGVVLLGGVNLLINPAMTTLSLLTGGLAIAYPQLKKGKGGKAKLHLATAALVAMTSALGLSILSSSAQALFFQEAESFFNTTFDLSGEAVGVIFNIFRAMYVIYLIYSAISVWTSYQRDEDWMSVAKAPMVIFVGGTLIDVVASVIVT